MNEHSLHDNLTEYLKVCTRYFTGREWVFEALDRWLAEEGPRFFLIEGEPGSGKTSIAARLSEFSRGKSQPPLNYPRLGHNFLSAVHFCRAQDASLINPYRFACLLADQLLQRYDQYHMALLQGSATQTIDIKAVLNVGENAGGTFTGINIGKLSLSGIPPEDAFDLLVRQPLEVMLEQGSHSSIVILVDGIDESLQYRHDIDIVSLIARTELLHHAVRFIVTSAPASKVIAALPKEHTYHLSLTSEKNARDIANDVNRYLWNTLNHANRLKDKLASDYPESQFVLDMQRKSEGNFLYLRYLLASLRSESVITNVTLNQSPSGLSGVYLAMLNDLFRRDSMRWEMHMPILGTLAVAQEPLTEKMISNIVNWPPADVRNRIDELQSLLNFAEELPPHQRTYSLYHRSFGDLLLNEEKSGTYWCPADQQHERIASYYQKTYRSAWNRSDTYGLRYTVPHLIDAARASEQPQRHDYTEKMVDILHNRGFLEVYKTKVGSLTSLQQMLDLAFRQAAHDDAINPALALPNLIHTAFALVNFRENGLKATEVFDLARDGKIAEAVNLLALFPIEPRWRQVANLLIAWLASERAAGEAQALLLQLEPACQAQAKQGTHIGQALLHLLQRIVVADQSVRLPTQVRSSPSADLIHATLKRIGGLPVEINVATACEQWKTQVGLQTAETLHSLEEMGETVFTYVANDADVLVAFAIANPIEGDTHLQSYLEILSTNTDRHYRDVAFWLLLEAILRHPDPHWVRRMLQSCVSMVLAGLENAYRGGLPIALTAIQAAQGPTQRLAAFEERVKEAQQPGARTDAWSVQRRKYAMFAEALTIFPQKRHLSRALLEQAHSLSDGYTRYRALAYLTLAETVRICGLERQWPVNEILTKAQIAAHNIQHSVFCARITARINAMQRRWWGESSTWNVAQLIHELTEESASARFAALHLVGERYTNRKKDVNTALLPETFYCANTLYTLAKTYQLDAAELLSLNHSNHWSLDTVLPMDAEVSIPDPEFAAFVAARLAAEALITPSVPDEERVFLIQSLAPIAARNPTVLDTVFARLLLAAYRTDPDPLANEKLMQRLENAVVSGQPLSTITK